MRTQDACDQLTRYGGGVFNEQLVIVLEALVELNDDLHHDRHKDLIHLDLVALRASVGNVFLAQGEQL